MFKGSSKFLSFKPKTFYIFVKNDCEKNQNTLLLDLFKDPNTRNWNFPYLLFVKQSSIKLLFNNMPQENQVLRCYSCLAFQVHLVNKQKKWQCKMCNSKQSVKQVYGRGSGKDCRLHVMRLKELQFSGQTRNDRDTEDVNELEVQDCEPATETFTMNDNVNESKWAQYMDKADENSNEEKEMENEFCDRKKRKLNRDFDYSSSERSYELSEKNECESNAGNETENNKEHEKEFKRHGKAFYSDCSVKSGSKWSAFIDGEQSLSDEECNSKTGATLMNKTELKQNRTRILLGQESLNSEKSPETDRETCPAYNKCLLNTHSEGNPVLTLNEKDRTGNLTILETINDEDDLDEILNI